MADISIGELQETSLPRFEELRKTRTVARVAGRPELEAARAVLSSSVGSGMANGLGIDGDTALDLL